MWRVLTVGLMLVGCGDSGSSTTDAAILRTPPFQLLICTSGSPGDSTCPYNVVSLDSLGGPHGAALKFVVHTLPADVDHIELTGSGPVHIDGLWFDEYSDVAVMGSRTFIADSLDAGMSVGPIALEFSGSHQLMVRVDAIH